ncbi:DUF4386 domain-containing protein [Candidatus Neomarinimicrobiota bacterium]
MNSPNKTARVAGLLYLLMAPFGMFGIMYVTATLIVPGDAATTANNIKASESLFRLGIVSALITQLIQIFVVLFLYKLLKPVNKNLAMLMVIFILIGVPIAMLSELSRFAALLLLSGAEHLAAFTTDQLHAQVMQFLDIREHGISIAGIFWGLWLFPMGYLVLKSGYIPRILGILLIIGGFGYLIESVALFVFPNFDATISLYTFWGEVLFPLWLIIKGVNVEQWEKRALESA